ncbi:MAG: RluA family pseudouridine synthase [Pseudomonadota bacterium]
MVAQTDESATFCADVDAASAGMRLDLFLVVRVPASITRSQAKRFIDDGDVTVNDEKTKPSHKLKVGDRVVFVPPQAVPASAVPEDIPLKILYEDSHLIVVDKPAGLVVHPAAGHPTGTLVNALLHHCPDMAGVGGEQRPGIVHRLDKDTSGALVVAKDDQTHAALAALFERHDLLRIYHAVVAPAPAPAKDAGTISTLYGRHPRDRKRFTAKVSRGRRAVTNWRVLERFDSLAALLECRLETGRTHQIRVHMLENGCPVLGDPVYGRRPADPRVAAIARMIGRQALHASVLAFRHPWTGARLDLESPLPDGIRDVLAALRSLPLRKRQTDTNI